MTENRVSVDASEPIDLSFPVDPGHFRWSGQRERTERLEEGAPFTTTRFAQSAHAFTHADAPSHVDRDGADLATLPVSTWIGVASVLDVSSVPAGTAITADDLDAAAGGRELDELLLVSTGWDTRRSIDEPTYWSDAPWLDRGAATWLAAQGPRAVGFDFPQDSGIRRAVAGEHPSREEFDSHDVLLRTGVSLIEYLRGLSALPERVFLMAAPAALVDSDGGPVRAVAFRLTP
jgi:arylformamidase